MTLNIPDEVIDAATDAQLAGYEPNDYAFAQVIAGWAVMEARKPILNYLNHCQLMRMEPTTRGLQNALADRIGG